MLFLPGNPNRNLNNHARVDSDPPETSGFRKNSDSSHKMEQTSSRPEQNFYQSTVVTPNNGSSSSTNYFKSKLYVDDRGHADRDVKRNDADKRVDIGKKHDTDNATHDNDYHHDYDGDDDDDNSSLSVADDRIDANVNDLTYEDDDGSDHDDDNSDKIHDNKNVTSKPEYDYVYYYYYDYIDPEDEGRAGRKKTPKHFEVLPNPSYLVDVDVGETTQEDELTTVPTIASSESASTTTTTTTT